MINLSIFASGVGSNAANIISYFRNRNDIKVKHVCSNRASAPVLAKAQRHGVQTHTFNKSELQNGNVARFLMDEEIDFVILAGFLLLLPPAFVEVFKNRIINIHPSLLPKYGGKGMYGHHVHRAVIKNREVQSGISIHLVSEIYDWGEILFQRAIPVAPEDSPESLAKKIHVLEHKYFPETIASYIKTFSG